MRSHGHLHQALPEKDDHLLLLSLAQLQAAKLPDTSPASPTTPSEAGIDNNAFVAELMFHIGLVGPRSVNTCVFFRGEGSRGVGQVAQVRS